MAGLLLPLPRLHFLVLLLQLPGFRHRKARLWCREWFLLLHHLLPRLLFFFLKMVSLLGSLAPFPDLD